MSLDSSNVPQIPRLTRLQYLERRIKDLEIYNRALLAKDFAVIEQLGHRMKGNGSTFGFPELTALGASLENAAAESNEARVQPLIDEMSELVHHALKTLQHESAQ